MELLIFNVGFCSFMFQKINALAKPCSICSLLLSGSVHLSPVSWFDSWIFFAFFLPLILHTHFYLQIESSCSFCLGKPIGAWHELIFGKFAMYKLPLVPGLKLDVRPSG